MGYVPTFFDSDRVRWSSVCQCGRWAPAAYLELCHLGACRPGGWSGSLRQLEEAIWVAHGKLPGCRPDRRTLSGTVKAMASSGIITIEPKGAFSSIRVVRQEGEGGEIGGGADHHYIKRSGGVADHPGVEAQPTTGGGAADHGGGAADHGGGAADHGGGVADHGGGAHHHSSEEEVSPPSIEGGDASEERMKSLAGPAASLRHPKGGSAAVSGSQAEEDTSPPGPPSGGADADDDRGAHLLDAWESAMDRANGHPVDGLPRGDIDAPDPETRLKRTIAQERAERATPRQLPLGVPPEVQARLEQCSWYTDPDGRYELPPDRKARPRRPRFQPQVVPPPPVERDIGWERRKAALGELAELVPAKEESDEG